MGLLRDAISSAMGPSQVQNGFNGPQIPFRNKNSTASRYNDDRYRTDDMDDRYSRSSTQNQSWRQQYQRPSSEDRYQQRTSYYDSRPARSYDARPSSEDRYQQRTPYYDNSPPSSHDVRDEPARYEDYDMKGCQIDNRRDFLYDDISRGSDPAYSQRSDFLPVVLPQIDYGDGTPFLRGYSNELTRRGVSRGQFFEVLDAINIAIIPNPENQIFQKGANIAGWFVPGAAGIGLMAGQLGVGAASAFGHVSMVNRVLSKANIELFLPHDLEICIAKTQNINDEVGISSNSTQQNQFNVIPPEQRIAMYGDLVAPLCEVLPPAQNGGRNDPLAFIGKRLSAKTAQKSLQKAQEKLAKGETKKMDSLDKKLKWIMVRPASPEAKAHWKKTLEQSDSDLREAQAKASHTSR